MSGGAFGEGRLGVGESPADLRLGLLGVAILVFFVIFLLRLFQLQILEGADLASRSLHNSVRTLRIEASRGDIVDREGRVLATSRPAYRVAVIPSEVAFPERTYRVLAELLGRDAEALRGAVGEPRGRRRFQPVVLEADLSHEQFARIETHRYALPGVVTDILPRRYYVEGSLAAHLLGTIGEIDAHQLGQPAFEGYRAGEIVGKSGLEARFETHLRGRAGGRNVVVDVAGREVEVRGEVQPVPGGRLQLTLDLDLQRVAEQAFASSDPKKPDKMGALVVIDPRNGDVLAMVSRPAYDPNQFAGGIDAASWSALLGAEWKPLRNRAISGQYSPGSTYKPFVAVAGLAEGVVDPHAESFCPGYYRLGRRVYRCWKRGGHGAVNLEQALIGSCDVYFYGLGVTLGIDTLARYAERFGLGRATGIGLSGEKPGLIPTRDWKRRARNEDWIEGETVSASIGQGFDLVTPLQLVVAYAAIANGGTIRRPRLVERLESWDGRLLSVEPTDPGAPVDVAPEVLERVRGALTAVVNAPHGTGARARLPDVLVAGKTGTTQVVSLDLVKDMEKDEIPIRYRDHALFAAFAPATAAEIAIAVLVEHAGSGGGSVAAPIARRVLARYFEKKQQEQRKELPEMREGRPQPSGPKGQAVQTAEIERAHEAGARVKEKPTPGARSARGSALEPMVEGGD